MTQHYCITPSDPICNSPSPSLQFQVRKQVQSLRTIISGLQAKSKERQWMKNQTQGELDDLRLIEGITGEKSIYKKRAEQVTATQENEETLWTDKRRITPGPSS